MAKDNTYSNPNKPAEQIGGTHYSRLGIEPIQFIETNGLGYHEGNVIKYVSRWRNKNGVEDLKKAKWYIERLLELENEKQPQEIEEGAGFTSPCACGQLECTDVGGVRSFKAGVYNDCEITEQEAVYVDAARYFTECRPDGLVCAYVEYDGNGDATHVNAFIHGIENDSVSFGLSDCKYFGGLYRNYKYGDSKDYYV